MNPVRSLIAVLGGVAIISLLVESLEFTLVNATADQPIQDMAGYFAARNEPGMLAAKLVYNTVAGLLGGYMTAKIAGFQEMKHAGAAAAVQTAALIWGFTMSEYAAFTPAWMRIALILITGPAMMVGASVRAHAARIADNPPREDS